VDKLINRIVEIEDEIIKVRRDLHKIPEVGFKEYKTTEYVAGYLEDCGYDVTIGPGDTGVVGLIKGKEEGKTIALRACLDALEVEEKGDLEYKSCQAGMMHACGHDGNMAVTLGAAKLAAEFKDRLKGNVKVIFQSSEENTGGAAAMIKAGVLENPHVDAIITPHIWNEPEFGAIGMRKGIVMASSDLFSIRVKGVPGHGAWPQAAVDPIPVAAEIVTSLQRLVSREIDPMKPCVLSIGKIEGGKAANIISEYVDIYGTVRAFDNEVRDHIENRISGLVESIAEANRATCIVKYDRVMPPINNNPEFVEDVGVYIKDLFPEITVTEEYPINMGCEEFSLFQEKVPGIFMLIGNHKPEEELIPLHNPGFYWHEENLVVGVKALTAVVFGYLK